MKKKTSYIPNFTIFQDDERDALSRFCDHQHCDQKGEYRAPKSRKKNEYLWFCLEHVKDYNRQWDYYKGMSQHEIDEDRKNDMTWQRPTWPLGEKGHANYDFRNTIPPHFDNFFENPHSSDETHSLSFKLGVDENKALKLMNLKIPLQMEDLKENYKLLVKKYHPDHNPTNPLAEDRLKEINQAYAILRRMIEQSKVVKN